MEAKRVLTRVLSQFPDEVRLSFGFRLFKLQLGERPNDVKPLTSIGSGVCELRDEDEREKIEDTIYVLHCFEKQSNKTSKHDLETARLRLKRVRARISEEKK